MWSSLQAVGIKEKNGGRRGWSLKIGDKSQWSHLDDQGNGRTKGKRTGMGRKIKSKSEIC